MKNITVTFKKFIQRYVDQLKRLNQMIEKSEILDDGSLFVKLQNGIKFYSKSGVYPFEIENGYLYRNRTRDKLIGGSDYGSFYHILKEIFINSDYDIYYQLRRGDVVIDAGANIGLFTVKAANEVGPEGKVIAVEPEKTHLSFLRRNIEANNLKNVEVIPKGLWSGQSRKNLHLYDHTGAHSIFSNEDLPQDYIQTGVIEVELDTIDNIYKKLELERVNFIKMDIEGAELEALNGAMETLISNDINLAVSAYHNVLGEPTYNVLVPQLEEIGYRVNRVGGTIYAEKNS